MVLEIFSLQNALNKIDIKNIVSEKINQDDPFLKGLILPELEPFRLQWIY